MTRFFLVSSVWILLHFSGFIKASLNERRLLNHLLECYVKEERPVADPCDRLPPENELCSHVEDLDFLPCPCRPPYARDRCTKGNNSEPVPLKLGLDLQQIIDMDEKQQILTINMWLRMEWKDFNLQWNPADYGNIEELNISPDRLWKPDILLESSTSEQFDTTFPTNILVSPDGTCSYLPPGIFQTTCKMDITWFPFDEQSCPFTFLSWTYSKKDLNMKLENDAAVTETYMPNAEWRLKGFPGEREESAYDCCPDPYVAITFTLQLQRRTMYYFNNLIFPCGIIAILAILGFYVPPDCGEKLTLQITILMALTFYMNMITDMVPQSSETPLILIYFACIMIMVANSTTCTILILSYHHIVSENTKMPKSVRFIFLETLPYFLFMSRPGYAYSWKTMKLQKKMKKLSKNTSISLISNVIDAETSYLESASFVQPNHCSHWPNVSRTPLESTLRNILREIKFVTAKMDEEKEAGETESDWKFAAMVIDRLCFVLFFLFSFLLTTAFILAAPEIFVE